MFFNVSLEVFKKISRHRFLNWKNVFAKKRGLPENEAVASATGLICGHCVFVFVS